MADFSSTTLNPVDAPANSYNPLSAAGCAPGQPVYQTATPSTVGLARANTMAALPVAGLASKGASAGERVNVQFSGPLTLTEAEWSAVVGGSTGLTAGSVYYVSVATPGLLTTTAPGDDFVAPVGIATSPTTMLVQISFPTPG